MHLDPITEEIRAIRHALAEQFDNDLTRIVADVRERESQSGRIFVRLPKRPAKLVSLTNQNLEPESAAKLSEAE